MTVLRIKVLVCLCCLLLVSHDVFQYIATDSPDNCINLITFHSALYVNSYIYIITVLIV
jgi:hypothetical protein